MMLSPAQHSTSSSSMEQHQQQQHGRRSASSVTSPFHHRSAASLADAAFMRGQLMMNPPSVPSVEGRRRARMQQQQHQQQQHHQHSPVFTSPSPSRDPYKRASLHEPLGAHSPVPLYTQSSSALGGRRTHALSTLAIPSVGVMHHHHQQQQQHSHSTRDFHLNPANSNFILRKSKSTLGQVSYTDEDGEISPGVEFTDEGLTLAEDDQHPNFYRHQHDPLSIPYNCTADHSGSSGSRKSSLAPSTSTAELKSPSSFSSSSSHHPHPAGSYSSSSGCSTQSSASSATNSFSRASKARSSLHDAAANFRDFVQQYERGLMECISSVEEEQQQQQMTNQLEEEDGADQCLAAVAGEDHEEQQQRLPKNTTNTSRMAGQQDSSSREDEDQQQQLKNSHDEVPPPSSTSPFISSPPPPPLSHSLRLQLEKVRALRDQYETGYRTSEALERLMKLSKRTRDCDREYRANERALAAIEAQLEAMIGTFRIRVEELEGFARICPRDSYEIEFRHGKQRRVLRVRIGKALERLWDGGLQEVEFRGALKATVVCRLREVKSSWRVAAVWSKRNVTLGVNTISMSELLVAVSRGRQIVLDANASGSLKLRIRCQWAPSLADCSAAEASEHHSSPSNKSSSSSTLINTSFRSENLLSNSFALSRRSQQQQTLNSTEQKASTLTSVPPLTPIPRVNLLQQQRSVSPYVRNSSPQQHHPKNNNLKATADLSRSLLTLPSYYYSSHVVNPLLAAGHAEEETQEEEEEEENASSITPSGHSLRHRAASIASEQVRHRGSCSSRSPSPSSSSSVASSLSSSPSSTLSLGGNSSDNNSPTHYHHQSSSHFLADKAAAKAKSKPSSGLQAKLDRLIGELYSLQSALEDYRGQYVELTMMSITVGKLMAHLETVDCAEEEEEESAVDQQEDNSCSLVDEVETALAEFDFLEDKSMLEGEAEDKNPPAPQSSSTTSTTSSHLDLWSSVLSLHVASSLEQLGHVGSWILKGREAAALARLRADAFAFDLIYEQLVSEGRSSALGKDRRVLELWQFASDRLTSTTNSNDGGQSSGHRQHQHHQHHNHRPYILSWRQLCQLLIDLMKELGLGGDESNSNSNSFNSEEESEDSLRYAAEWLCGLMVPLNMTKVTVLDLRAFFELDLWRGGFRAGNAGQMMSRRDSLRSNGGGNMHSLSGALQSQTLLQQQQQQLTLKRLFQIALDVDRLMRRSKVLSLQSLEAILFERFNVNCLWVPADVTLTMVGLLYENHSTEKQSKLTTSEVKKLDRYREMGKVATNWIIWLLQDCRFEIREHVLAGLESSTAFTRRACCYGIMYMFKLMRRSTQYDQSSSSSSSSAALQGSSSRRGSTSSSFVGPSSAAYAPSSGQFFGQELDSLLYVSMEDVDGRVREEAKKALKCLGHYGQQRLHQMERSRMGFNGGSNNSATATNGPPPPPPPPSSKTTDGFGLHRFGGVHHHQAGPGFRCSMPNLNGI